MAIDLGGRVAVVTGGAKGIGRATVQALAGAGAFVAVWDLDDDAGPQLAREVGGRFDTVDVTDRGRIDAAVAALVEARGRVDILINNAGIIRDAQLVKVEGGAVAGAMSTPDFDAVVDVNLKGVFACTQAVVPHMIAGGYGRIVTASSVVGVYGNFGQTNYAATKAGVIGMTRVWARELGRYGITANAVAPGFVETEMTKALPPGLLERMIAATPVRRMGRAEEVAGVYLFLASELAGFVNGAVISVDGGLVPGT